MSDVVDDLVLMIEWHLVKHRHIRGSEEQLQTSAGHEEGIVVGPTLRFDAQHIDIGGEEEAHNSNKDMGRSGGSRIWVIFAVGLQVLILLLFFACLIMFFLPPVIPVVPRVLFPVVSCRRVLFVFIRLCFVIRWLHRINWLNRVNRFDWINWLSFVVLWFIFVVLWFIFIINWLDWINWLCFVVFWLSFIIDRLNRVNRLYRVNRLDWIDWLGFVVLWFCFIIDRFDRVNRLNKVDRFLIVCRICDWVGFGICISFFFVLVVASLKRNSSVIFLLCQQSVSFFRRRYEW